MTESLGPFLEVARIQSEINRLFDNLLDLRRPNGQQGAWIPNVDIIETTAELVVSAELPGVEPGDLTVSVNGGNLILAGSKSGPREDDREGFHQVERTFGPFRRVINLGAPVNTRQAEASLADGLLRIRFPKVPNRRGEDVPIEVTTR
jgi:HSP20 family protein